MSSRAMRKLCNEPDIVLGAEGPNEEDDEEVIDAEPELQTASKPSKKKKKKKKEVVNPFELVRFTTWKFYFKYSAVPPHLSDMMGQIFC